MSSNEDQNARVLDQFRQQAKPYAEMVNKLGAALKSPLLQALKPAPGERALDVGCGTGRLSVALAPHVAKVTGVDLTAAMLKQAQALQLQEGISNIEWLEADSTALPLADGGFDLVFSQAMFHHAADPAATLAEMLRCCAPGGRIAVGDLTPAPEKDSAFNAIELLRDPSHRRAFTSEALRALGADLDLAEIVVQHYTSELPLEMTLATSFPDAGMLERVRELYARDAAASHDSLGMGSRMKDGEVWVSYPQTVVVWRR